MALNIYDFLGLDTNVDDNTVLANLNKVKAKWVNMRLNRPEIADSKLNIIRQLEEELKANPNLLTEHRKLFAEIQKEKKNAQEKAIRENAKIFVINGEIEESHLKALQNKNPTFTDTEILKILGARIKSKRKRSSTANEKGNFIEHTIYKGIVDKLKAIGKSDLYDFLNLKHSAPTAEISAREKDLYSRAMSGASNTENTLRKEICGFVRTWLIDEVKRLDYDHTLKYEPFQPVSHKIDQIISVGKLIQPSQYEKLVEECTKNGIPLEHAEDLIYEYAESKGITIVDGGLSSKVSTCRFCGSLNAKNTPICKGCGMPIVITCPGCGAKSESENELRCTKCGFNIGDMPLAIKALDQCDIKLGFNNIDGAMECYNEAARYWPGHKGLSATLTKIKDTAPAAPTALKATVCGNTVNLQWTGLRSKYVKYEYIVIRKNGSVPNSITDGEQIAVTSDDKISDIVRDAGINFYYAVYCRNDKRTSAQGAKSTEPVMIVDNISANDITFDIQENQIVFNFKKSRAACIEIYRDGNRLSSIMGNTFIDNNLITGHAYTYRFVAIYRDNNGNMKPASGLPMTLTPLAAPKPVELLMDEKGKEVLLSWKKPAFGSVIVYQSDKPFTILPGNKVPLDSAQFTRVETVNNSVRLFKNWSGIRFYLPVTVQGNIGVAGKGVSVTSIEKVSEASAINEGNKVEVRWVWSNCSAVRVSYSIDGKKCRDHDIEKDKSPDSRFTLTVPDSAKSITVSVMSLVRTPDRILTSEPIMQTLVLRATKVEFLRVSNLRRMFLLPSDEYELSIKTDSVLPCDLHVLVNESIPPANLVNYTPAAVIKASEVISGQPTVIKLRYTRRLKSAPIFFRIIAANRTMAKSLRLVSEIQQLK